MDSIKINLFLCLILFCSLNIKAQKIEIEIDVDIMRSIYFDGVTMKSLLENRTIRQLTVLEDNKDKTVYSINHSDTSIVISLAYEDKEGLKPQYQSKYDTAYNVTEVKYYYDSENSDIKEEVKRYEQQLINDEKHETTYRHQVLADGSIVDQDTITTISRILDFKGRPGIVIKKLKREGKLTEENEYYLYEYDDQKRLTESLKYGDDQSLSEVIVCEYLDEEGIVNLIVNGELFKLFYKNDKLIRSEVHRNTNFIQYRLYRYNSKDRLIKLTQFNKNDELELIYQYKYNN